MNTVQYIRREFVPTVDLQTLGNAYSNLEQGHQAAVQAASDLQAAVGALDMNEAEDGFKQQLVSEIQDTIDNNTLYGNSWAALDNLVTQKGNIQSDGRVIGRLRNQQAKKEYDAKVDAMNISEGIKQMYKEENPYYYEDGGIDPKTGRYLPGAKWEATTEPVNSIDQFAFMNAAKNILTAKKGNNVNIQYLDAAGNPTTDPSKSVDGAMYQQIGTSWEILPKEEIKEAIKLARSTVTGAEDSFRQDYRYERWKYDKAVEKARAEGGDTTPYVEGFTDKDGNVIEYEDWMDAKFDKFADLTKYTHTFTDVKMGTAYENKRRRDYASKSGASVNDLIAKGTLGGNDLGTIEVKQSAYSSAVKAKDSSGQNAKNILMSTGIKELGEFSDFEEAYNSALQNGAKDAKGVAQYYIDKAGDALNQDDKTKLINAVMAYNKSNIEINDMLNKAGADADALKFSANINSQNYTKDNKYSKAIIEHLNDLFKNNDKVEYVVGSDVVTKLKGVYEVQDLDDLGIDYQNNSDGTYSFIFTPKTRNLLPLFDSNLDKADGMVRGNAWDWFKTKTLANAYSGNYVSKYYNKNGKVFTNNQDGLRGIGRLYNIGYDAASKIEEKVGTAVGTENVLGTDVTTPGEIWVRENAINMGYTPSQAKEEEEKYKERVDLMIANGNLAGAAMYLVGDPNDLNSPKNFVKEVETANQLNRLIQHMYLDNPNNIKREWSGGTSTLPAGFMFTFTVPENDKSDIGTKYKGKTMGIYAAASLDDGSGYDPTTNPRFIAQNLITTSKATNSPLENMGYNNDLGDTRAVPTGNGYYDINFLGYENTIDEYEATDYAEQLYRLELFKAQLPTILSNINLTQEQRTQIVRNNIEALSNSLANITDTSPEEVALAIQNYMLNE